MDGFQFVASLVSSLAWPAVVAVVVFLFQKQIGELIGRLRSVKALGAEGTFDPKSAEATVALATATASAQAAAMITRPNEELRPLAEQLRDLATSAPQAAVLQAYEEVERALSRRIREANVALPDRISGYQLIDLALSNGVITRETGQAIRSILVLRNLAAHDGEVDTTKALDYLALADAVTHSIEAVRVFAGNASSVGTAHDATVKPTSGDTGP
jgi:uncharacterized protein YutE (UPF0331/DUF86 family)